MVVAVRWLGVEDAVLHKAIGENRSEFTRVKRDGGSNG